MSVLVQIRDVPEALHKELEARAALAGVSLSDYLLREMARLAERPRWDEVVSRLRSRAPVSPTVSTADLVAIEREGR